MPKSSIATRRPPLRSSASKAAAPARSSISPPSVTSTVSLAGSNPLSPHQSEEGGGEARAQHVGSGDVDREAELGERPGPRRRRDDRLALHMVGELNQIVRTLGDAEQGVGAQFAIFGVRPARQRLRADDSSGGDRDLRLEADLDFVLVERAAQVDFEPVAALGGAFGAVLEHPDRGTVGALGFGERGAGAAEQCGGIVAGLRGGNARFGAQSDDMVARGERPGRSPRSARRRGSGPRRASPARRAAPRTRPPPSAPRAGACRRRRHGVRFAARPPAAPASPVVRPKAALIAS